MGSNPEGLAIVIGAGGFRGRAAIGVLGALADAGVRPGALIGVSAGAVIGACWAFFGWDAARMEREAGSLTSGNLFTHALTRTFPATLPLLKSRCGVIPGWTDRLATYDWSSPLQNGVGRFGVICYDLDDRRIRLFATGIDNEGVALDQAVRGSAAVYPIYRPVRVLTATRRFSLVDGGVKEKLPFERALGEPFCAHTVIAVSFAPVPRAAGRTQRAVKVSEVSGRRVIILNPDTGLFGSFVASSSSTQALVAAGRSMVKIGRAHV